jgi:hypothetical protein
MNIRATWLAIGAHILILAAYFLATPILATLAPADSQTYVYLQQEWLFATDFAGSVVPAVVLGRRFNGSPWPTAVVLRAFAFLPYTVIFLFGHPIEFLASRPISYHITCLVLAGCTSILILKCSRR